MDFESFATRLEAWETYKESGAISSEVVDSFQGKTVLVTGGAGAIGSNLTLALSDFVGEEGLVVVLDDLSAVTVNHPWSIVNRRNILFVYGSITDEEKLKYVFTKKPDIVFHLAAFFANQNSVDFPESSIETDIVGLNKLLQYSQMAGVGRFVNASSGCAIYGSFPKLPLSEDFISMKLTTPYQINKMTAEMYCNFYYHHFGLNIVNCRFFNSYGPGEIPGRYRNVIPNFIYWAIKGFDLPITGDGQETRDFTYTYDLVQGLLASAFYEDAIGENFNLARGEEVTILEMVKAVKSATNSRSEIYHLPKRKWDTKPRLCASVSKAESLIDYKPQYGFQDGFSFKVRWYKENFELIDRLADFPPGMNPALSGK